MTRTTDTMNVSLSPKFEKYVKGLVKRGRYNSASEVVRTGLRLLEEQEQENEIKLQELKRLIQTGIDGGPATPLDMDEIKREARKQFEQRRASAA